MPMSISNYVTATWTIYVVSQAADLVVRVWGSSCLVVQGSGDGIVYSISKP